MSGTISAGQAIDLVTSDTNATAAANPIPIVAKPALPNPRGSSRRTTQATSTPRASHAPVRQIAATTEPVRNVGKADASGQVGEVQRERPRCRRGPDE